MPTTTVVLCVGLEYVLALKNGGERYGGGRDLQDWWTHNLASSDDLPESPIKT